MEKDVNNGTEQAADGGRRQVTVPTFIFGANDFPDKAIGLVDSGYVMDCGPGYGVTFHELVNPGSLEYGENPKAWEEVSDPRICIWFCREEPLNVLIDKLEKIREKLREDKKNAGEG